MMASHLIRRKTKHGIRRMPDQDYVEGEGELPTPFSRFFPRSNKRCEEERYHAAGWPFFRDVYRTMRDEACLVSGYEKHLRFSQKFNQDAPLCIPEDSAHTPLSWWHCLRFLFCWWIQMMPFHTLPLCFRVEMVKQVSSPVTILSKKWSSSLYPWSISDVMDFRWTLWSSLILDARVPIFKMLYPSPNTTSAHAHIFIHTLKLVNISSGNLLFNKKLNDGTLTKRNIIVGHFVSLVCGHVIGYWRHTSLIGQWLALLTKNTQSNYAMLLMTSGLTLEYGTD